LSIAFICLFGEGELRAEGITIKGDHPSQNIDMKIDGETIGTVLQTLHEKYGIEISGEDKLASDDAVSMTISGTLPAILERLLRNQNYMIVRSAKNATGVGKILIAGSNQDDSGSKKSQTPAAPPANNPAMP
jgi:hypothetical protein